MPYHHNWNNYPHYYKRYNMFCGGPSRLVWFAFGSVATWAWYRHHENHHRGAAWSTCSPPRVGYNNNNNNNNSDPGPGRVHGQWEQRSADQSQSPPTNNPNYNNYNNNASSPSPGVGRDYSQSQSESMMTDRDHERLRQIGRSAEETISGMSEATVDSMMGALQRLKDRLAERRGQQQLQEIGPQQANPTLSTSPEEPTGPRHRV